MLFAIRYIAVMLVVVLVISVGGWFLGETLNDMMPDDGIDVYPSLEAAKAAMNRGHAIAHWIEVALIFISGVLVFFIMWPKRENAEARNGKGGAPTAAA